MNQPEQTERTYRRPGKRSYAHPAGSRCVCEECTVALRMRLGVWGAVEPELRE